MVVFFPILNFQGYLIYILLSKNVDLPAFNPIILSKFILINQGIISPINKIVFIINNHEPFLNLLEKFITILPIQEAIFPYSIF